MEKKEVKMNQKTSIVRSGWGILLSSQATARLLAFNESELTSNHLSETRRHWKYFTKRICLILSGILVVS